MSKFLDAAKAINESNDYWEVDQALYDLERPVYAYAASGWPNRENWDTVEFRRERERLTQLLAKKYEEKYPERIAAQKKAAYDRSFFGRVSNFFRSKN